MTTFPPDKGCLITVATAPGVRSTEDYFDDGDNL
jgi:hypothetical protein